MADKKPKRQTVSIVYQPPLGPPRITKAPAQFTWNKGRNGKAGYYRAKIPFRIGRAKLVSKSSKELKFTQSDAYLYVRM